MRKDRFKRLLAGTMLALIVTTPTLAFAAPDEVESPTAPAIAPQNSDSGSLDIKDTLDKLLAAGDAQITEKLRDVITAMQFDRRMDRAPERKAIEAFYAARGYAPLWISDGGLNARAKSAIARLKNAAADGLDPADYPAPEFGSFSDAATLADGDIKLTSSVLTFARHLAAGRIAPTRVSAEVDYGNHVPEPADILKKVADASDVNAALEGFNPPHGGFRALKQKLAELRANPNAGEPDNRIPDGLAIKPGAKDARVPSLRTRLGVAGKPDGHTYDKELFIAIKNLQSRADIKPTGVIDGKTLAAINGPKQGRQVERVLANLERWRWLPRDLGRAYVMVNIPDFTLKVVGDNNTVWRTKIVAGKPQTPTPLTTASMDSVIVNPSWHVPQSIIQNELLPHYARDPNIFARMGLVVKRRPDGHINVVQPPGAGNALGRIKFNFPNKFQVYLHDTPQKQLFSHDKRAFSHGCMRVEDPTKFGEVMLHLAMNGQTPNSQQIASLFGRAEHTYKLINRPMVHLTYQTAFVDDGGKLILRDDLYGFDARITAILHSDERRIADVTPPQDPKRDAATAKGNQEILSRVERREAQNPFTFFERTFR